MQTFYPPSYLPEPRLSVPLNAWMPDSPGTRAVPGGSKSRASPSRTLTSLLPAFFCLRTQGEDGMDLVDACEGSSFQKGISSYSLAWKGLECSGPLEWAVSLVNDKLLS